MVCSPTVLRFALAGAFSIAGLTSPALAASEPRTKLVSCGDESCLLITGYRDDPASSVSINGNAVSVTGERSWRARVPVSMVREWALPYARTIEVAYGDTVASVDLPIGLLGHATDLAALEVRIY